MEKANLDTLDSFTTLDGSQIRELAGPAWTPARHQSLAEARVWKQLHRRGDLVPLLQQLPAVYAEVFALHYIERAPLSEMMRRTGASAGVITHRIAQASERLHALPSHRTAGARPASSPRGRNRPRPRRIPANGRTPPPP